MTYEDITLIVSATLTIAYNHWVRYGTPIKISDAPMVAEDVTKAILGGYQCPI